MKALLIWKQGVDGIRFFAIEEPSSEELSILQEADGAYINPDYMQGSFGECGLAGLDFVHAAVSSTERLQSYSGYAIKWFSLWLRNEIPEDLVSDEGRFDRVFVSGFYNPARNPAKLFIMKRDADRSMPTDS